MFMVRLSRILNDVVAIFQLTQRRHSDSSWLKKSNSAIPLISSAYHAADIRIRPRWVSFAGCFCSGRFYALMRHDLRTPDCPCENALAWSAISHTLPFVASDNAYL